MMLAPLSTHDLLLLLLLLLLLPFAPELVLQCQKVLLCMSMLGVVVHFQC